MKCLREGPVEVVVHSLGKSGHTRRRVSTHQGLGCPRHHDPIVILFTVRWAIGKVHYINGANPLVKIGGCLTMSPTHLVPLDY